MENAGGSGVDPNEVASCRTRLNLETKAWRLSLARLGVNVLPEALLDGQADNILVLDLKKNALQLLPSELFLRLPQLQEVIVSENALSYIPETIGVATGLRKLNLRSNKIKDLPEGICRLHALEEVNLSRNVLECLPTAIGRLKNLRRLDLADNCLQEVPEEAGLLIRLEHVDLSGNPVQRLPLLIQRLETKGELLRSRARRRLLVRRALHIRGSVRAAFAKEALLDET